MKTKAGMKMEEDQLVTKVLDRLTKTSRKKSMESIVAEASSIDLTNPARPSDR